ncbi:hypothetical protein ACIA8K_29900 [Catenuloplanes sp. NPDC051500]|uniref:hypothetical protein n=1 Tax=Catenuloplanes sp. NPDC051500 TaxID=3363959 RepID=UPI0037912F8A
MSAVPRPARLEALIPSPVLGEPDAPSPVPRKALPLARLQARRSGRLVYGLATLDMKGRVADRVLMRELGWEPGTRLDMRERGALLFITEDEAGVFSVRRDGRLVLPAGVRRWAGLSAGSRVLLVADPKIGRLVIHPPVALDGMVAAAQAAALGGVSDRG